MKIIAGDRELTLEEMVALARRDTTLEVSKAAWARITDSRAIADEELERGAIVYGLTVGLGGKVSMPIERDSVPEFEKSVISARIIGIGEPLDEAVCRRALGLRIVNICHGRSAVSPHVVEQLLAMYNAGVTPIVASLGSIGSSDLGQCSQLCATVTGVGQVWVDGKQMSAVDGLASIGRKPADLGPKDALGLFNSGAVTQSIAVDYLASLRIVLDAATVAAVASCEAYGVNPSPFTREVTVTKAVPGGEKASDAIMSLLEGSWTLEQGAIPQAQHAISFRTLVPLIAVVEECVERFSDLIEREVNSSTDSPVVLHDSRTVRSSVNFQPLAAAVAGDALAIALTHWSNASANRTIKMANHSIPDVPRFLAPDEGQSVGFNALMKSTVAMATRVRFEANPGSVDFFAVSDGTEDVASQLPLVVEKLGRQVESLRRLVALEAFTAHQLLSLRQPRRWGRAATRVLDVCGRHVPVIEHDQPLGGFVDALTECIARGELH